MRMKEAVIHNYKSIRSEIRKCRVVMEEDVTTLIGANESGKTNILEALSKFTTGKFEQDDIPYTSDAASFDEEEQNRLPMVSVSFTVDDDDRASLGKAIADLGNQDSVTLTRDFGRAAHLGRTSYRHDVTN